MHRSLEILEIVEMICAHFFPDQNASIYWREEATRDLVAIATTCRMFRDPALDLVWRAQRTLEHLLRCMPGDLWEPPVVPKCTHLLRLRRPIMPTDWDRPFFYASRIRHLSVYYAARLPAPHVLRELSLCLPRDCLFPNLRSMDCSSSASELAQYFHLLFGPLTSRLSIYLDSDRSFDLSLHPAQYLT
ncbi:hypothetical protein C8R44DRAFT_755517 [Mycena epipterygia]|nr:hypothetical protein C8R44DRAFT_755517 [Mycena epipterygia]